MLRKGFTTPVQLIPLILGITGAVGAATGVAGLALQGVQQGQLTKQLTEQEELSKLQKKLGEYQLKQYEEMYNAPKIPMTTRSMTAAQTVQRNLNVANTITNTGLGTIQRGNIINTTAQVHGFNNAAANLETPINQFRPMRSAQQNNLMRNSVDLATSSRGFGNLAYNAGDMFDTPLVQSRASSVASRRAAVDFNRMSTPAVMNATQNIEMSRLQSPTQRFRQPTGTFNPKPAVTQPAIRYHAGNEYVNIDLQEHIPASRRLNLQPRRFSSMLQTMRNRIVRGVQRERDVRGYRGERQRLLLQGFEDEPVLPRRPFAMGNFLNRYKRRLAVGAGIVGGAALLGGTIAGIASKRKKTMQSNEPSGMFERLSTVGTTTYAGGGVGGGGGAGFPFWNSGASAKYKKRRGSKAKGSKAKGRKRRGSKVKGGVTKKAGKRRGKGGRAKRTKGINKKRGKASKRSKFFD